MTGYSLSQSKSSLNQVNDGSADIETPLFSIIVPSYNRAHTVSRCLDSFLAQSCQSFESIIVDDGSADDTKKIVQSYADKNARIRYVHQENSGATVARNHGVSVATGGYVLFIDSDDDAYPNWLAEIAKLIEVERPDVACCGVAIADQEGNVYDAVLPRMEPTTPLHQRGVFLTGTYAIRRELFNEIGGFCPSLKAHQSTELRMRLIEACQKNNYRIESIAQPLTRYFTDSPDGIRRNSLAKMEATQYILDNHRDKFATRKRLASWLAAAGGCAANLGRYAEARRYFADAAKQTPGLWKNYARFLICCTPLLRRLFWRRAR